MVMTTDDHRTDGLDLFFNPKSVAIIGASETVRFGYATTKYLLNSKFKTFPVNLNKKTVFDHKTYKNVNDIPEPIELAIILVGNEYVLQVIKDCIKKGVKGIILETAGFAETGIKRFVDYQQEIKEIAKKANVRIIGPNCIGVSDFYTEFTSGDVDFTKMRKGNISVIAQSGVLGNIFIDWASAGQNMGISKAITLGNKIDVNEIDMLQYLDKDPTTKVITLYLEGVNEGAEFIKTLKNMTKPIIVLKNGRTDWGLKAIQSHTGSLAGNDKIFDAVVNQHPCIFRVNNFYEMFNVAQIFASQPLPNGNNVAVITGSGSLGSLACDEIKRLGLNLAKLDENTIKIMQEVSPEWVSLKNPVDLGPSMASTLIPSQKAVFKDSNVNCVLFIFSVPRWPFEKFWLSITPWIRQFKKLSEKFRKPCAIVVYGSRWMYDFVLKSCIKFNIPVMDRISHALMAFRMMYDYNFSLQS